ncbi:shikimate kinase [Lacrimispora celerecrescens]|uniref:Shikimate kinase n=2 Tax=Lacrimispora celerecrescens TaxID=29354 RepID=A0A084JKA4_9FIRM|nr:shikimate kinase [Lacrimispora celerecrescens]
MLCGENDFNKVVFLIGNASVGKMTVGQELMKITDLRLFHNHMTIEPVIEIFGSYNGKIISRLREVVFEEYAASNNYGLIFTYMWAFDQKSDWDYIEHVKDIFRPYETEFYYVELVASREVRLERNTTENRLRNKASKRDITISNQRLIVDDERYRLVSNDGEIPFDNYIKIDNSNISPDIVAQKIKVLFEL